MRGSGCEEDASDGRGRPDGGEVGAGVRDSSERARVETGGCGG